MEIIVTRHAGTVAWLRNLGYNAQVIDHATEEDVRGMDVIGVLPLHLAAAAASVTVVDLPGLRPDQRGMDLTPDEMDAAGARLTRYVVRAEGSGGELDPSGSGERAPLPGPPKTMGYDEGLPGLAPGEDN